MKAWVRKFKGRWRLDTGASKPRIRLMFDDEAAARKRERELRDERRLFGSAGTFTPVQRGDISQALGRLENANLPVSLWTIVCRFTSGITSRRRARPRSEPFWTTWYSTRAR